MCLYPARLLNKGNLPKESGRLCCNLSGGCYWALNQEKYIIMPIIRQIYHFAGTFGGL